MTSTKGNTDGLHIRHNQLKDAHCQAMSGSHGNISQCTAMVMLVNQMLCSQSCQGMDTAKKLDNG